MDWIFEPDSNVSGRSICFICVLTGGGGCPPVMCNAYNPCASKFCIVDFCNAQAPCYLI